MVAPPGAKFQSKINGLILAPFANDEIENEVLYNRCSTFVLSGSGLKSTVGNVDELKQCLDVLSVWLLSSFRE